MDTKQYLDFLAAHGDSYDGENWQILSVSPDNTLYLVKDSNQICYVTTPDMITTMPYSIALAEKVVAHYASDSPLVAIQDAVANNKIKPSKLIGICLTADDIKWLESDGIHGMVRSIEHSN